MKTNTRISFIDRDFPATPFFVEFLDKILNNRDEQSNWHDQLSENLYSDSAKFPEYIQETLPKLLKNPMGQKAVNRVNELFVAILTGSVNQIVSFHNLYKFIVVVGIPRSGGSYLTKQLYNALGMDASRVPRCIAHDGFPDISPFYLVKDYNAYTGMQRRMAEYLAMVELFFAKSRLHQGYIVVPKKAFKAAYHGAFFNAIVGPQTEYLVTLRHPVPCCISTYEKSGGLPEDGKFRARSAIEICAGRDNLFLAAETESTILSKDYFEVFLRYWEQYHYNLALTGLSANKNLTIIPYTQEAMQNTTQQLFTRFGHAGSPEPFKVFDKSNEHPAWLKKAEASIKRVQSVWQSVGLTFPLEDVMQAW